jgi:hypothetical protein
MTHPSDDDTLASADQIPQMIQDAVRCLSKIQLAPSQPIGSIDNDNLKTLIHGVIFLNDIADFYIEKLCDGDITHEDLKKDPLFNMFAQSTANAIVDIANMNWNTDLNEDQLHLLCELTQLKGNCIILSPKKLRDEPIISSFLNSLDKAIRSRHHMAAQLFVN